MLDGIFHRPIKPNMQALFCKSKGKMVRNKMQWGHQI